MKLGNYEILDELGAGGMGRVRLGRTATGRLVVLKNALRADDDDDERLRDEARVGLRCRHPGVVETIELFDAPDERGRRRPVLVTAFVPGKSLLELRAAGALDALVVSRIGRQLASALEAIHGVVDEAGAPLGVLHRDVTAGNCLLGDDGDARLIDFGIARSRETRALRTQTGLVRGTLRYLAPELFAGGAYSVQSDLWALGVVLFEALVGRAAVVGNDTLAMARICMGNLLELRDGEHPEPRVVKAIAQLLQKNPADRPARARDVAAHFAMLEKLLPGDGAILARAAVARATPSLDPVLVHGETSVELADIVGSSVEEPFEHAQPPTQAELLPPTPPQGISRGRRTVADDLRAYAASLTAMEKSLSQAEQARDAADAAWRARRAQLPPTSLWSPAAVATAGAAVVVPRASPSVVAADVAALEPTGLVAPSPASSSTLAGVPPLVFAMPPETNYGEEALSSSAPVSSVADLAATAGTPARAGFDPRALDHVLHAFVHDEDTPTPSLSPVVVSARLQRVIDEASPGALLQQARRRHRWKVAARVVVGVVVAVVIALLSWPLRH